MSARRPLYRIRYDPIIGMWVVSATEHAPDGFRNSTAWPSWPEAMRIAHRVVGMLASVQRERDKRNSRSPGQWLKLPGYAQGGIVQPIPTGRTNVPPLEQYVRDTKYQGGLLGEPDERWNLRDGGRRYDVLADGLANLTYEIKPGLVRLETALPWADNDQNRKK